MSAAVMPPRPISLACVLARAAGSPISARTIELGTTAMCVVAERPLALDETLSFELSGDDGRIAGQARVVCQERSDAYRLRFARLSEPMARSLREVVAAWE